MNMECDLLIKNGTLIDPGAGMNMKADIATIGDKIAFIGSDSGHIHAGLTIDATDRVITPGLIDMHIHAYWGVSHYGIDPDPYCLPSGVTTAIDAGSAGSWTFPALRRYVIEASETRLFAFLNISGTGMISDDVGELEDIRHANVQRSVDMCEKNRDIMLGVKVRLSDFVAAENDMAALKRAREAADALELPIMVHHGRTYSHLDNIVEVMKEGDILTHCYHGHPEGVLDEKGKVKSSVREAVARGVIVDVGHGQGSFAFEVAAKAMDQGLMPDFISSDLHFYNTEGPAFDLATTVSKFVYMGMTLENALEKCTSKPAKFLKLQDEIGTLKEGAQADIAIFEFAEGSFEFVDTVGEKRIGSKRLIPRGTIREGRLIKTEKDRIAG